ncbi:ABC-three component system middle component 1 [Photobacterium leiognathi]|uniref:ABC-three component system middle component 1 n=1 Tax=Photobacterium leiognathi TaxID=553611 RepID=UPI0027399A1D|nr:ABC-three component system middle component 1 [Photobacterium leiognathi]
MKLLIKDIDLGFLSSQYENIQFHILRSDDRLSFISCIVCVCETAYDIIENWRSIQNMIAVYHQHSGSFDAWNMYLAFVSVESIPVWEKYEIENNKFSARKIVIDDFLEVPNIHHLIIELEKQLLGSDLTLESRADQPKENLTHLEKYYRGAPLDSKNESRAKRALMIDNIIESLSCNEN